MVTSLLYQLLCQPMAFFYRTRCVSTRTAISSEAEGRRVLRGTFTNEDVNEVYDGPSASNNKSQQITTNHSDISGYFKQPKSPCIYCTVWNPDPDHVTCHCTPFLAVIDSFILLHVILLFLNIALYTHRQCWKEMSIVSTKFIVKLCFEFLLGKAPGGQSSQPATWWLWWSTWTQQVGISDTVCWKCSINRVCFMFFNFERDYDRPWHFCCFSFVVGILKQFQAQTQRRWASSKTGNVVRRRSHFQSLWPTRQKPAEIGRNEKTSKPGMDVRWRETQPRRNKDMRNKLVTININKHQ